MGTESKHTQGAWVAIHRGALGSRVEAGQSAGAIIADCPLHDVDGIMNDRRHLVTDEEAAANARLIAAAPEMLDSLKGCIRMLEAVSYTAGLDKHQMERLAKAKAIIAEAEQ